MRSPEEASARRVWLQENVVLVRLGSSQGTFLRRFGRKSGGHERQMGGDELLCAGEGPS